MVLSALAQAGDLLESAIKRHFGAKDTSQLIPGSWRTDGSARRLSGRCRGCAPDWHSAPRDGCCRPRPPGMVGAMTPAQPSAKVGAKAGSGSRAAARDAAGRHRLDRIEHDRSVTARSGALRGRGHHRVPQRRGVGAGLRATWRALCGGQATPMPYADLKEGLAGSGIEAAAGPAAMVEAAERPADWVMAAITGAASLKPTLAAAERGATVALANKECLVCAGALFMRRAAAAGAKVLPVDSEHNAIFQALSAGRREEVRRSHPDRLRRPVPHVSRRSSSAMSRSSRP